jgi:long-chain acyl-CoA synthetase
MPDTTSEPVIASTVALLPASAANRFGERLAARHKVEDEWQELTYADAGTAIEELALGLIDIGIEPGDRVCLLSDTRLEWTLASYAISAAGAVVVPIYPTNSPHECEWVAGNSEARAVVCENASQLAKIERVRSALPRLVYAIGIEPGGGELTLEQLRERGRSADVQQLAKRQADVEPEDAYTIVYTSGTTGPPKGVVLTHANAISVCKMVQELEFVEPGEVTYLYLPLAHVFALTAQLASFDQGTAVVYYGRDTKKILQEIIETQPTYLPSVPRIFEKLYAAATVMAEKSGEEDRERFEPAIKLGVEVRRRRQHGEAVPEEMEGQFEEADKQIFERVRQLFGGPIRQAVTGAAPIASEILEFFYAAGVPVLEGWGLTETTAVGTVATLEQFKFGTVGRPLPAVEIRITPEDGEILVRARTCSASTGAIPRRPRKRWSTAGFTPAIWVSSTTTAS